jgi:hypothetical protein
VAVLLLAIPSSGQARLGLAAFRAQAVLVARASPDPVLPAVLVQASLLRVAPGVTAFHPSARFRVLASRAVRVARAALFERRLRH